MLVGNEPISGLYYEVLGQREEQGSPPLLFIHGGGGSGAAFRTNLAGGAGWADQLAARGHEVWVTDWPGCGRSGNRHLVDIEYRDVVDGYRHLVRDVIGQPVIVLPHSMGGAVAWKLVEHERDRIAGVVALAASYPGNVRPRSTVIESDGTFLRARFDETGVEFAVDRTRGYLYEDSYIYDQAIHTSTRFPMGRVDDLRAALLGLPPKMLLQRIGVLPGLPAVEDTRPFAGVPIRLVSGTDDPAHTHATEGSTVEQLLSWGADAALAALGDLGIQGNGHFLFFEDNEREILDVVAAQIDDVCRSASSSSAI